MESNDISCQPSVEVKQYNRKQLPGDGAAGSPSWSSSSSQPSRPAHTDSNNSRKKHHKAGEENPTYADSKDLVGEENPSQCANGTRSRSSQASQMPRKICCKQNTHRAEHLVAENDLGVGKVRVTDRETHRRHRCCNVPEVQEPICVPYGDQNEQKTGNFIQGSCFHRSSPAEPRGICYHTTCRITSCGR